ncbi:MAG: hypothetical protein QOI07_448 [Verrucomicrobiota bacterium]|jgi:hypothetical protein
MNGPNARLRALRGVLVVVGLFSAVVVFFGCSKPEEPITPSAQTPTNAANQAYQLGTVIKFGKGGDSDRFRVSGWSQNEEQHTWTEGNTAVLQFSGLPSSQPLALTVNAVGFTKDPQLVSQPTEVYANGTKIADWEVRDIKPYNASIPSGIIDSTGKLTLEFRIPNATSPQSVGVSADARRIGVDVFDLVIRQTQ